jgi:extradiol dioxygenase family protein
MDAEFQLIRVGDYFTPKQNGEIDFNDSIKILKKVAEQNGNGKAKNMLVDVRDFVTVLSVPEIYEVVTELGKYRGQFNMKIAVVYGPQYDEEKTRFFEMSAQNRGFIINAFTDYDEAVKWLTN